MTRSNSITFVVSLAALPLAALALAGCGGSKASASARPMTPDGRPLTVGVANSRLGKILVNSQGRTLYLFQKDTGTKSACTGACANNWPPLRATGKPTVGSGASASLIATSMHSDGKPQVTYNSHPLYLFIGDSKAGDTNGENVNAFGGSWLAVSPAGSEVAGSTPGGGY